MPFPLLVIKIFSCIFRELRYKIRSFFELQKNMYLLLRVAPKTHRMALQEDFLEIVWSLKQGESLYHSAMSCLPQVANAIFKQLGKKGSPPPSRLEFTFTSSFLLLVASWYFLQVFLFQRECIDSVEDSHWNKKSHHRIYDDFL